METPTKSRSGKEIVRAMLERKKRIQQESIEAYQNNPEIRVAVARLKEINGKRSV